MMDLENLLSADAKQRILDIKQVLDDIQPAVDKLVAEGFPFSAHQQELSKFRERNDKFIRLFKITPMTTL